MEQAETATATERHGDWMETYTGRRFWPLDPRPEEVCIEDIAHALSLICRFNGCCWSFYSVAQHSLLAASVLREWGGHPEQQFRALLHDASEAYLGDMIRPIKRYLVGWREIEAKVQAAVFQAFGIPAHHIVTEELVDHVDELLLATEARDLQMNQGKLWTLRYPPIETLRIEPMPPQEAEEAFLAEAERLGVAL